MATERIAVSEVEAVIRQLRDVIGARVVADNAGVIQEIHVLSQGEKSPKQLVRDVESALQARLGITLDHKKVSVAQVQGPHRPAPEAASPRLQFSDVSISLAGQTAEATVHIRLQDGVYEGSAQGSSSTAGQVKTVAAATLKAIQACLPANQMMMVEDAVVTTVGGHQVVTVVVTLGGSRSDEVLCGSSLVRQDTVKAAVFATLDAVNRRLKFGE
jgi:hypothetical protein